MYIVHMKLKPYQCPRGLEVTPKISYVIGIISLNINIIEN